MLHGAQVGDFFARRTMQGRSGEAVASLGCAQVEWYLGAALALRRERYSAELGWHGSVGWFDVNHIEKERMGENGSRRWNVCTCANGGPRRTESLKLVRFS